MDLKCNFYISLLTKYEIQVTLLHLWSLNEQDVTRYLSYVLSLPPSKDLHALEVTEGLIYTVFEHFQGVIMKARVTLILQSEKKGPFQSDLQVSGL